MAIIECSCCSGFVFWEGFVLGALPFFESGPSIASLSVNLGQGAP